MHNKGIFWLASYPKSGNTWFRIFLANLLNTSDAPIDLNHLNTGMIASNRQWMDNALGFNSSDLSHDEIDALRPLVYQWYSETMETIGYHKIHDAYTYIRDDNPLIPTQGCLGAIYFIRNPLDVSVSFANHLSCTIDDAIAYMGNREYAFCSGKYRQYDQLRQQLLSWSLHVNSWVSAKNMNLLIIRYEDMKQHPEETFIKAVQFLGLDKTREAIELAHRQSSIAHLQQLETINGFREKPANVKQFFRKGIVGDWQTALTEQQVKRIISDHKAVMMAFGYLDAQGNPIV